MTNLTLNLNVSTMQYREYQKDFDDKLCQALVEHQIVLGQMPTGMGKSPILGKITDKFKNIVPETALIAHRKELIGQLSLTLSGENIEHKIDAPEKVIGEIISNQYDEYNKEFYNPKANVTLMSVKSALIKYRNNPEALARMGFWACDEAHHALRENEWGQLINLFPKHALGLGVTATAERLGGEGLGAHASGFFHHLIQGPSVRWGIEQGYLSDYKIVVPKDDYIIASKSQGDYSKPLQREAFVKSKIVGNLLENYRRYADGQQTIVFASDIRSGEEIEAEFIQGGLPFKLLTSLTGERERYRYVRAFREGSLLGLINIDLFDEGFNVPAVECIVMARKTKSLSKFLQMAGRGMRNFEGKDFLTIIDPVGNVLEHGLPCKKRIWTLDDRKGKRRSNLVSDIKICTECLAAYERYLTECPYCGHSESPSRRTSLKQVDGDLILLDREFLEALEKKTKLKSPETLATKVGKAAGPLAANRAMKRQIERIRIQKRLSEVIENWSIKIKRNWREVHKTFYLLTGHTINQALAQPSREMLKIEKKLLGE